MQSINELIRNINNGTRAAHSFIIEGRSSDKRNAFVNELAAGLECTSLDDTDRPCGKCPACRQAAAGTSMDIIRMTKSVSSGKSGRETYKVEDAAAFIERLSMGAYGRYLIGIIDDADILSETIQNKLLKTLEEPSYNTIILMAAANRDNLLSTVRSRCSDIRISDYIEGDGDEAEGGQDSPAEFRDLAVMIRSRRTAFSDYRSAVDKNIKTREEALAFLRTLEEDIRESMVSGEGDRSPLQYAADIENINIARMDIYRDMNHSKALRRLFLETR